MYWDNEKQTYLPAPTDSNAGQNPNASTAVGKEHKEKREKPKSKTAQQVFCYTLLLLELGDSAHVLSAKTDRCLLQHEQPLVQT